jgi:P4 family phage/plasmid primase-like protien
MTVQYSFEDMVRSVDASDASDARRLPPDASTPAWAAYDAFVGRIFTSSPGVRAYLMDALAAALTGENLQAIYFHYNAAGSNGKSSLWSRLVKQAFGALFVKCQSSLLNAFSATSGPNEELMSTRGKRVVLFSEPSAKIKLSAAVIKELTGGDEQSTRAMYGRKQNFVMNATVHVLCNKIPEMDDFDGGMSRRIRCIPYGSTFVDEEDKASPVKHVYLKHDMDDDESTWGKCLMWEVMRAAQVRVAARREGRRHLAAAPDVVMIATRQLIERESHVLSFVSKRLEKRSDGHNASFVTLKDAYDAFESQCKADKMRAILKKSEFSEDMLRILGPYSPPSGARKNYWRGWVLVEDEKETTPAADDLEPARC